MDRQQGSAPVLEAVALYLAQGGTPFHTPGHKQGRFGDVALRRLLGPAMAIDIDPATLPTPMGEMAPDALVAEAEARLAAVYGAARSFFLVGGTSGGLHALLLAALPVGARLLLPRNAHRSVFAGLALAGASPQFLPLRLDPFWGLPRAAAPDDFRTADRGPNEGSDLGPDMAPAAFFVTSPDYYGLVPDLPGIAHVAAEAGVPLLVDEAHGPHLPFLPTRLPTALASGAAATVQSTHKLLGSLVQSSWLHVNTPLAGRLTSEHIAAALGLVGTSSPSFLLLASLDATRRWAAQYGRAAFAAAVELVEDLRREIAGIPGLQVLDTDEARRLGYVGLDPLKLTVSVRGLGCLGPEAEAFLVTRGIRPELADPFNLLFIITPADSAETAAKLIAGLKALAVDMVGTTALGLPSRREDLAQLITGLPSGSPAAACPPRQAALAGSRLIPLAQAAGKVVVECVGPYPPGIPVVIPGEVLDPARRDYLLGLARAGLRVVGLSEVGSAPGIRVADVI